MGTTWIDSSILVFFQHLGIFGPFAIEILDVVLFMPFSIDLLLIAMISASSSYWITVAYVASATSEHWPALSPWIS